MMETEKLNNILYSDAKSLGACDKVMGLWTHNLNNNELIDLFVHNQEFCIEKDFPSIPFIEANFTKEERNSKNVWVNEKDIILRNKSGLMVVGGSTNGLLMFDNFDAVTIYVRHDANINVSAKGFSKVFIHLYNNAKVNIEQSDFAKVYVYKRSQNSSCEYDGDVTIRKN